MSMKHTTDFPFEAAYCTVARHITRSTQPLTNLILSYLLQTSPLTRKGVWQQLSIFLVVLSEQSCFCASQSDCRSMLSVACIWATMVRYTCTCATCSSHKYHPHHLMIHTTKKAFNCQQTLSTMYVCVWGGGGSGNETKVKFKPSPCLTRCWLKKTKHSRRS